MLTYTGDFSRELLRNFLRIMIPSLLLLGGLFIIFYRLSVNTLEQDIQQQEQHSIELARQTIELELSQLSGDVKFIAAQSNLSNWLKNKNFDTKNQLQQDLASFSLHRGIYHQIRFIDELGVEIIRINWNQGTPQILNESQLQNKSHRRYVAKTLSLGARQLYVSPFDLNVENQQIEIPQTPIIRIATPIIGENGNQQGLIIVNYLGKNLLDKLREIRDVNKSAVWLLNGDGYWLIGPSKEVEWGFMYENRSEQRFNQRSPEAWQTMLTATEQDQFQTDSGLYTYARIDNTNSPLGDSSETWVILTHISGDKLSALTSQKLHENITAFVFIAILMGIISWILALKNRQKQQTEKNIRENEKRFRRLLDAAPDAIVITDQQGRIQLANQQAKTCFGYSKQELSQININTLIPERFHPNLLSRQNPDQLTRVSPEMVSEDKLYGLQKNGTEFPVEISLNPLETSSGILVISIIRDITERKRLEETRRQVKERYQSLVNNLPVGVFRCEPEIEGQFIEINPAMGEIFSTTSTDELFDISINQLFVSRSQWQELIQQLLKQGHYKSRELNLMTVKGLKFSASITAVLKTEKNGKPFMDGIVEDISLWKEQDKKIQALNKNLKARTLQLEMINQELEAFSYSVSHDLRAPLRAMDGFSQTLINEYQHQLDEKGNDRLNRIRNAAQRMATLIDALLQLAKISRADLIRQSTPLSSLAAELVSEICIDDTRQSQIVIQPDLKVMTDPRLIRIVLTNLINNAWKFTRQCRVTKIEIGSLKERSPEIIYVKDNGVGFEMDYADKLFGAFQRLHSPNDYPGTGIGLATVKRIINKHGGKIWVESQPGAGTTFYFSLE